MTRPRCAIWRSVHRGRGYWLGQLVLYVVAWQDAVLAGIVSASGVLTFVTVTPGAIPGRPSGTKTVVRSSPLASYSSTFTPVAGTITLLPTTPWPDPWRQAHSTEPPPILSDNPATATRGSRSRRLGAGALRRVRRAQLPALGPGPSAARSW